MSFDNYINLVQESFISRGNELISELKSHQQKIVNLYKQINKAAFNDGAESEFNKLTAILQGANQEYKNFVNSNLDEILKHPQASTMYREFAIAAKKALEV